MDAVEETCGGQHAARSGPKHAYGWHAGKNIKRGVSHNCKGAERAALYLRYSSQQREPRDVNVLAEECCSERAVAIKGYLVKGDAFNAVQNLGGDIGLPADTADTQVNSAGISFRLLDQLLVGLNWRVRMHHDYCRPLYSENNGLEVGIGEGRKP